MEPRNWFQGMNSASLCSLAGRYDNPIPTWFLAPIDYLKIPAQVWSKWAGNFVGPDSTIKYRYRSPGSPFTTAKFISIVSLVFLCRCTRTVTGSQGYISGSHKVYIKSFTVYVPSSDLGLSQPLSRQRVWSSPAGEGLGEFPIPTTGKKLRTLPTLWRPWTSKNAADNMETYFPGALYLYL